MCVYVCIWRSFHHLSKTLLRSNLAALIWFVFECRNTAVQQIYGDHTTQSTLPSLMLTFDIIHSNSAHIRTQCLYKHSFQRNMLVIMLIRGWSTVSNESSRRHKVFQILGSVKVWEISVRNPKDYLTCVWTWTFRLTSNLTLIFSWLTIQRLCFSLWLMKEHEWDASNRLADIATQQNCHTGHRIAAWVSESVCKKETDSTHDNFSFFSCILTQSHIHFPTTWIKNNI